MKISLRSRTGRHNLVIPRPKAEESAVAGKSRSLAEFIPSEVEGLGMTFPVGFRRLAVFAGFAMMALFLFSSCRGNGTLTSNVNTPTGSIAGTPGVSATRVSGSASGGLSPIKGGTVTLYQAGSTTPLATSATDSNGAFQLSLPSLNSNGLYYLVVTNGNAGNGSNNANIQEMAILGTGATIPSTASVNELTTSASLLVGNNLGFLQEGSGGAVTLATPSSTATVTNGRLQYLNFISINNGTLNTGNSNLTSTHQSALATMANAFAACVESSSQCATLFSNAANSAGSAVNVLDAGYKMLNGLTSITGINSQASSLSNTTGYTIPSTPSSLNVPFPTQQQSYNLSASSPGGFGALAPDSSQNAWIVGAANAVKVSTGGLVLANNASFSQSQALAIDASNNVWVIDYNTHNLTELNSSGTVVTTNSSLRTGMLGITIDPSGNIWVCGNGIVYEFNSSGTSINSSLATAPFAIAADASGNLWYLNSNGGGIVELNSSGSVLQTIPSLGGFSSFTYSSLVFDSSGNLWIAANSRVFKMSSSGALLSTSSVGSFGNPGPLAVDAVGNIWVDQFPSRSSMQVISPTGQTLGTISFSSIPVGIAIDSSGDVLLSGGNGLTILQNMTAGPQFFPYSGPVFPL